MKRPKLVTNETLLLSIDQLKTALAVNEIPLTYDQFAEKFGYKVSTVRKKVCLGEIPARKLGRGRPVIFLSDYYSQYKTGV